MYLSDWLVFRVCLTLHTASALWNIVHDCDETFNYWEPLHHLLHGRGFQTWEYAPEYALRSYLYLWLYSPPALLVGWLGGARVTQFYAVRLWMALWTAAAETVAFSAVKRRLDGRQKSQQQSVYSAGFVAFSALSAGLFSSSTAFLPSAFAMQLAYACLGAWVAGRDFLAVGCVAAMAIVGWPFAAALGAPLALDLAVLRGRPGRFLAYAGLWGLVLAVPVALADCWAYGRVTVSPLNLLRYNVLNSGSSLYGTAPASYYVMNYALNFTPLMAPLLLLGFLAHPSGVLGPPLGRQLALWLSPLLVWNAVFFAQAHKEERFLYPCYPFLCLAAAAALDRLRRRLGTWVVPCILGAYLALSASRIGAIALGYQSHVTVYHRLSLHPPGRLCLGKEWYRFPSSFLLPNNWTVEFVRSEFRGQLPGKFGLDGQPFNLENREETARYVDVAAACDYLVDRRGGATALEPDFAGQPAQWRVLEDLPFLEPDTSHRILRAFYVPGLFEREVAFTSYVLLRRVR